jgi:hypothetical protein
LCELLDRVANLLVQNAPVSDDDDRVEHRAVVSAQTDELMRKPGDRVGFAAARRVLDQIPLTGSALLGIGEQPVDHVQLVVPRPDLNGLLLAGPVVFRFDNLRVVLENVGQPIPGEQAFPEVIGLQAIGVRRVAGAVVPTLIEGQEPGALPLEMCAEADLVVVHAEVDDASPELEELLPRVTVPFVLFNSVVHGLLGQAVLQLEGRDRQAVDEEPEVERALGLVAAVAELSRN